MKLQSLLSVVIGLGMTFAVSGCNSSDSDSSNKSSPSQGADSAAHDHMGHDHGGDSGKTDMEKMTESLAAFSEEDRQSAMKQHFCPVTGEMLGTMGAPEKVEVEGQTVWICCDGCKDKLLADPEKYLAKLSD